MPERIRPGTVALDGDDWSLKGYLGDEWLLRRAYAPDTRDVHGWWPARVPGSVLDDVVRAGAAPDPLVGLNSLACEWVERRSWVYRRKVLVDQPGRAAELHFDGIDHAAAVYVNGERVGEHVGAFTPARFDVTSHLRRGGNTIAVVVAPAPDGEPHIGRTDRVRNTKSRMTYGWDFCPRIVHLGIWDRARLVFPGTVYVDELAVRPRVSPSGDEATLWWRAETRVGDDGPARMHAELVHGAQAVASSTEEVDLRGPQHILEGSLHVPEPALWWPNGYGGQPLYRLRVHVTSEYGTDTAEATTAFRTLELARNADAPDDARPYTVVVNGRRIYVQGWNWVPMHVHHGVEDADRLDHLLGLAARSGANLLRVWGGGLIEKTAFYERCDRLGLLVWQEFPLSSSLHGSVPATDPEYVTTVADAARAIVPRRRNHPSLALWCGGNELDGADGKPAGGSEAVLAALEKVVAELDPDRPWLPTSPTGPHPTCDLAAIEADPQGQHDVHGPWEHQGLTAQRTLHDRATSLLHSEFGVEGMSDVATIEAYLSPGNRWPADRSNPHVVHRGDFWVNTPLLEDVFGPIADLRTLVAASQFLQADGLRYAVEANRRRQWRNSGSIPWQLNEPFPNVFCTSAVDFAGRPKPAYYAVAEAYADVLVSARVPHQAWAGHDHFEAAVWAGSRTEGLPGARVDVALRDRTGRQWQAEHLAIDVPAAGFLPAGAVRWPLADAPQDLFWLDLALRDGEERVRSVNRSLCSRGSDLRAMRDLPRPSLAVTWTGPGRRLAVRNTGDNVAVGVRAVDARPVRAPGYVWFDTGYLTVFPGEAVTIGVGWIGIPADEAAVLVDAWNLEGVSP